MASNRQLLGVIILSASKGLLRQPHWGIYKNTCRKMREPPATRILISFPFSTVRRQITMPAR